MKLKQAALASIVALLSVGPVGAEESTLAQLELALRNAAVGAQRSLVALEVSRVSDVGPQQRAQRGQNPFQQFFQQFARGRRTHAEYFKRPGGKVSGFLVSGDGKILTSYYNVAGKLDGVRVYLPGGKVAMAKLLGADKHNDIALLQAEVPANSNLPHLKPAPTSGVKIGSFVVLASRSTTTTRHGTEWGIVSAINRFSGTTLQIDARINYGSTGGPVVDLHGRLVGMACRLTHWSRMGQNSGVGYAVSGAYLQKIMPELAAGKTIEAPKRPFLGIQGADADPGVRITQIVAGTAAQKAGMRAGDVILRFGKHKVTTMIALVQIIGRHRIGQTVKVVVRRGDKQLTFELKLGARKEGQ